MEQIVKYIKSLLDPPTSEKTEKILEQYRINPDEMKESETLDQSHLTPEERKEANALKYTFTEKEINWSQLQPYGITPELLEEHNCMGALLKGRKSPCVLPFNAMMGNVKVETVGRIAFRREQDGNVTLVFHGVRKTPELDKPFFGHVFTKEDREALLETGNLGRLVPLLNPQTNEKSPCYVSLDKLTNEIIAHRAEFVSTPKTIKGVTLTDAQYADLKSGKSIFVKGMTAESGVTFNADIQFNADKRGLEFTFESNKLKESKTETNRVLVHQKIGGVQLTKEQQTDIAAGKAVLVEGLKNKQGKIYSAYVVKNDEKDKLDFYSKNPNDLKQGEKQKKSKGVKQ